MSAECQLYGKISGAHGGTSNWWELYPINRKVIESLPNEDEFPPLVRDMFKLPTSPEQNSPILYRNQVIHFGASFNHFDVAYDDWLKKFESLLSKLYWYEAVVHIEMELFGAFEFHWKATLESIRNFGIENPEPVNKWDFRKIKRD